MLIGHAVSWYSAMLVKSGRDLKSWCGNHSKSDLSLDSWGEYLVLSALCLTDMFPWQSHLTLRLFIRGCYIGSLSSNVAIFMDVWDVEKYDFTHSGSPRLWEASMKLVPDSAVKQKDKDWYRCQCEDSLGQYAITISDDQGGVPQYAHWTELLSLLFLLRDCSSYRSHYKGTFSVSVPGIESETEQCFLWHSELQHLFWSIHLYVCLQLSVFPFSKSDATSLDCMVS